MKLLFIKDTERPGGGKPFKEGKVQEFSGLVREWCLDQIANGNAKEVENTNTNFVEQVNEINISRIKKKRNKKE